jgi:hypothetical protein
MRRREFIAALGGAVAWPLVARAQQQPVKPPTVGFLGSGTLAAQGPWLAAFVQRLHELGWIEGRNLAIEYRVLSRPTAGASCLAHRGSARLAALSDTFPLRPAQPFWLSCLLHLAKAGVCPDGRLLLIC